MPINKEIEEAFGWRALPEQVVAVSRWADDDDQLDALSLLGRDWRGLSCAEWNAKSDAIHHFVPAAFAYYLPSVLTLVAADPAQWLAPTDSILGMLDRSPTPAYWDDHLLGCFNDLREAEFAALANWLLFLAEHPEQTQCDDGTLGRAFDTIELLRQHFRDLHDIQSAV
ncbi:hypothetical protein ACFOLJ_04160 [Rugamonas sp. CCM 8940]|uniref:hypothetical protein n=1 Tax=Rugamonas sp. CCM 8940 TaxID=2765359 RepID=UPI00360B7043